MPSSTSAGQRLALGTRVTTSSWPRTSPRAWTYFRWYSSDSSSVPITTSATRAAALSAAAAAR